jgi:hypothetical protein
MTMTHQRADTTLTAALKGASTPHIWLHTGSPGENGTSNVAQTDVPADIARKEIAFGDIANHATNTERRVLNTGAIEWTGAQIDSGQEITHFSIWSALTEGSPEFISTVAAAKTTGSDGVTIAIGDVEVAISVFVKPA